ncbi:MAG TPA: hypothetical protein DCQ14_06080 [Firmicutes bacterium]|nr:hypothetical protein [Bacillota bacterium]
MILARYLSGKNAAGEQLLFQEVADFAGEHPSLGANMLRPIKRMYNIIPSILHHHERYDGSGFPSGLKDRKYLWVPALLTLLISLIMQPQRTLITDTKLYGKELIC